MDFNKVLLTRSIKENLLLQAKLEKVGFITCNSPLICYKVLDVNFNEIINKFKNVIITSKFAAKIAAANINYNINCFVVGEISSQILQQNKFIKIAATYNTVEELLMKMPKVKEIIYLHGNYISFYPPNIWASKIIYTVEYEKDLTNETKKNLSLGQISYILIYSYNTAQSLIRLLEKNSLVFVLQYIRIICISSKIAELFKDLAQTVLFPEVPTSDNMVKILLNYDKYK